MKYPRIGEISSKSPKGKCAICGKTKSDMRVDIQVDVFRGNDEVINCHSGSCLKVLKEWYRK